MEDVNLRNVVRFLIMKKENIKLANIKTDGLLQTDRQTDTTDRQTDGWTDGMA